MILQKTKIDRSQNEDYFDIKMSNFFSYQHFVTRSFKSDGMKASEQERKTESAGKGASCERIMQDTRSGHSLRIIFTD